jgi:hypothetical protein
MAPEHTAWTDRRVVRDSKSGHSMSALGQKQTSRLARAMSALPLKADIGCSMSVKGLVS